MNPHYPYNNSFDALVGMLLIITGMVLLGYVLLHLLWWVFLVVVGIALIVSGARLRRRAQFFSWFWRQ